jgi:hypothetical protein
VGQREGTDLDIGSKLSQDVSGVVLADVVLSVSAGRGGPKGVKIDAGGHGTANLFGSFPDGLYKGGRKGRERLRISKDERRGRERGTNEGSGRSLVGKKEGERSRQLQGSSEN